MSSPLTLRPMTLGELLDRVFFLYRTHFVLFIGITALPHLLSLALQIFGIAFNGATPPTTFGMMAFNIPFMLLQVLVGLIIYGATQAATVTAVSRLYLGQRVTVKEAYSTVLRRVVPITWMIVVVYFVAFLGLFLCGFGVFLWIIWFLTIPVAILEGKGLGESAARSVELTKGWRPHILVINVLYVVLVYVFTLLWEVPLLVSFMFNANVNDPTTVMPPWAAVGFVVGAFLTSCLSSPLLALSSSLVYYNQRVTKEAFDLEHMMSTMDDIPAPPPIS